MNTTAKAPFESQINVRQSKHSGDWIREVYTGGRWVHLGVFDTREAANRG